MTKTELDQIQKLQEFGLSPYCSRAYLALLQLGPSDARSVSRAARIPAPKVYGTLNQLMEKGLARLVLERPKRYEPVAFGEYLEQERAARLEEARRLETVAPLLAPLFRLPPKHGSSDRGSFSLVRGRRNVLQKHRQLAGEVEDSLLLVLSDGAFARLGHARTLLETAHARGVKARVLAPFLPGQAAERASLAKLADVRVKPIVKSRDGSVGYALFDESEALVTHFVPDDGNLQDGHDVAVHVTENAIAQSLHDVHAHLWNTARPATRKRPAGSRPR